ncbi:MAG TPA: acyltransferase [Chitinophagaceae bacterium]|nr:acyltransferase [Chitinophagaceae bacterium]
MMRFFAWFIKKFYKSIGSKYYLDILNNLFMTNWFFQKVLRNHIEVPHPVHYTTLVAGYHNIIFNKNNQAILKSFAVSGGCYIGIADGSTLEIGDDTIWAWNINIQTSNHDFIDRNQYTVKSVKIGKNCWIGGNVTILPGVELGDNVTIGANSVVTKSFPSNVVIAGVPAKVIRELE